MLLLLACSASPPDAQGFAALHAAVYDAYAIGAHPDPLHEQLARSFSGQELTERYVEWWHTLSEMEEAGTEVELVDVEHQQVRALQGRIHAEWTVSAVVRHRSHEHTRTNRYAALFQVEQGRITDTRMQDMERLNLEEQGELLPLGELF